MPAGDAVGEERDRRISGEVGGASNLLVLSPTMEPSARRAYFESLMPSDPQNARVLAINYTRSPEDWLDDWQSHVGTRPADCAVVSVGDGTRSAAAATPGSDLGWAVRSVESPDDLTGLGITIGKYLSTWSDGGEVVITLDSLTVLLQYVDLQRAFRFLHVMTNRTKSAGAESHYHLDPSAHDTKTVATLSSLFDAVVEYDDGTWSVRSR